MADILRGKFITFDGLDGSGLTEQIEILREWLRRSGYDMHRVAFTAEPSQGPAGTEIRHALEGRLNIGEEALALLFAADRADHLDGFIMPRLEAGIHVICDRYYLSFLAYQSFLLPDAWDWLWQLNARNQRPDLTIFLRSPPEVCVERIRRKFAPERYERPEILKGVSVQFDRIIPLLQDRRGEDIRVLDSSGSMESTHQQIVKLIAPIILPSGETSTEE